MDPLMVLLILLAGTAGGFLNTLAGGGSIITLPLLIFLGLPAPVANGTNRIALMWQNMVAISNFRHKGFFPWKLGIIWGIPALLGAIVGSQLAITIPEETFNRILAVVMFLVLGLIIWKPKTAPHLKIEKIASNNKVLGALIFFFIGIYGGFIQIGVGIFIIALLTFLTGSSLVQINSLKVIIIAIYMVASLLVFIINGQIDWALGLTLAVGNGLGAWLGSTLAIRRGDRWVKIVLAIAVVLLAGRLLGFY